MSQLNWTPSALPPAGPDTARQDRARRGIATLLALVALAGLAVLIGAGIWLRLMRGGQAVETLHSRQAAVPLVEVVKLAAVTTPQRVDLPGTMQAFDSATLFARATGYVGQRNVDIGSHVKAGDVLAVIAAPDLDQQLAQARAKFAQMQAAVDQAKANQSLANVTNRRTERLVREGWTSQQQGDTDSSTFVARTAGVSLAEANLRAQAAEVNRLVELTGYERIIAPYDGTITARDIDVGSLVIANAASGTPMFSIARTQKLRVQVYVPQEYVFGLKDGQDASITVPQLPGRVFHGKVARNANALATNTRTLLTEVDIDNADGVLSPGLYCVVHLEHARTQPVVQIPSEAVMFSKNGLQAAVLVDGHIQIRTLDIAADNGAELDVRGGLNPGDALIRTPPVDATDGMRADARPGS